MSDDMLPSAQEPAVGGPVQRRVRPFAWACVWPAEDGCWGGGFTTLNKHAAMNYMAGATERSSSCRPTLVPLYDAQAVDEILASERERCAAACEHFAAYLTDGKLAEALRDMAALMRRMKA